MGSQLEDIIVQKVHVILESLPQGAEIRESVELRNVLAALEGRTPNWLDGARTVHKMAA